MTFITAQKKRTTSIVTFALDTRVGIQVVERAEDDQEQPPENKRDSFADAPPVGVEDGVDRLGANVLPSRRSFGRCARGLDHGSRSLGKDMAFKRALMMNLKNPSSSQSANLIHVKSNEGCTWEF